MSNQTGLAKGLGTSDVSAAVLVDPGKGPSLHTFRIGADIGWTVVEVPDPAVPGKRAWEARQFTMLMEGKQASDRILDTARRTRPGWQVKTGVFALPTGLRAELAQCATAPRAAAAARVGAVLVQAWEVSQAASVSFAVPSGRGPGTARGRGGPRSVVSVADRLAAFEERAMAALASVDTDPEGALLAFGELRDEQQDMEQALRRAASYLDSLEAVLGDRFAG